MTDKPARKGDLALICRYMRSTAVNTFQSTETAWYEFCRVESASIAGKVNKLVNADGRVYKPGDFKRGIFIASRDDIRVDDLLSQAKGRNEFGTLWHARTFAQPFKRA